MKNDVILSIRGLRKDYGKATALRGIDLEVHRGEFLTFLGPSGSGKTTTLNLIAGFISPTAGTMRLDGAPLERLSTQKRNLGVVFQNYALFPHMTVKNNVAYPLKLRGIAARERNIAIENALKTVRLEEYADRFPKQLSGGQQQRVALARAMVYKPPLLLMDEPLGALDKKLRGWLQMELRRIHRELGTTFIYVTHDQEEALFLSDRIAIFNEGCIEQIGTASDLYERPNSLFVGKFIGESTILRGQIRAGMFTLEGVNYTKSTELGNGHAILLLRPEDITIGTDKDGDEVKIRGVLEDMVYTGASLRYTVETAWGVATTQTSLKERCDIQVGQEVWLSWTDDLGVLLPSEDDQ